MSEVHFLRAKTLSKETTRSKSNEEVFPRVLGHNLREVAAEYGEQANSKIDPSRIQHNAILFGPASSNEGTKLAWDAIYEAGIKVRANAVLGIEIIFSLPDSSNVNEMEYFDEAVKWAQRYFRLPLLSAIYHADEDHPHTHVIFLPIKGNKLLGNKIIGNKSDTNRMHSNFHNEVSSRFGFSKPGQAGRYTKAQRHAFALKAREDMRENSSLADGYINALAQAIYRHPDPLLAYMGVEMPSDPSKTVAGIFTKECHNESTRGRSLYH